MAEYIECRKCDSPYCDGCNTLTLSKMLHARKFDCLLDEHHCINPCADVEVVKYGRWKYICYEDGVHPKDVYECSNCGKREKVVHRKYLEEYKCCREYGAKMMEVDNG